ncbi:SDR family NAD(P)-dependent oxidoreductase [Streptosporangium sp. NPDC023963]|uniref:SDR family NAD(P)-dependent oxidoreductase n=1 Tax=Streptosporangium sp. NPDC023963 TaxID=3155608 RepID=UPI0034252473
MVVTSREATPRPRAGSRRPNAGVYAATKFGITAFSGSLRQEVTTQGLHVVIIEPGFVATEPAGAATRRSRGDRGTNDLRFSPHPRGAFRGAGA